MVDAVVDLAAELLQQHHQLALQRDWVVELDSTTAAKFSRHLIIKCAPKTRMPTSLGYSAMLCLTCEWAEHLPRRTPAGRG